VKSPTPIKGKMTSTDMAVTGTIKKTTITYKTYLSSPAGIMAVIKKTMLKNKRKVADISVFWTFVISTPFENYAEQVALLTR
jgi:hypothetical protein